MSTWRTRHELLGRYRSDWGVSFCHEFAVQSSLIDFLAESYDLDTRFDCALCVADTDQRWKRSWLYESETVVARTPDAHTAPADG